MAGIKISGLPAVGSALLTDFFPVVQGGVTSRETLSQVATLFNANLTFLPLAGGTMSGAIGMGTFKITNAADPTAAQDVATKNYVDTIAQGITVQGACYAGTTGALTATYNNGASGVGATLTNSGALAAFSTDSVSPALNARILVKNQAAPAQNGIYTLTTVGDGATAWVLTRATDYDQPAEINPGDLVIITAGSTLASTSWLQSGTVTTIGTDSITFTQFSTSLPISVANGGTGRTTGTTAYGLIAAGTTATAQQQTLATGLAGQVLLSGGAAALPAFSTTTYPSTNAVNTLLYASAANVMSALATANSGVLVTSAGGVPSISSTLPAFTTSSITFSPQTSGIVGTTTNNSASSGFVGEVISQSVPAGSAVSLSNGVSANVASISLTGGDWDVWANIWFVPAAGTVATYLAGAVNTTSAVFPAAPNGGAAVQSLMTFPASSPQGYFVGQTQIQVSSGASPQTVYLVGFAQFSVSTMTAYGFIGARRRR